jgi:hypothetical protein
MRISDLEPFTLSFTDEMTSYHGGQKDMVLRAMAHENQAGYLQYSVYDHIPAIQFISVDQGFSRLGVGTALVKKLQSLYPDQEIEWGTTTPDGEALRSSLPKKIVYNPLYRKYKDKLDEIKKMEEKYTEIFEHKNTSLEKKRELGNKWNQLRDLEYTLIEKLRGLSASKTLIEI